MTVIELVTIIFGAFASFWFLIWLGDLVARSPKLFYYGKFRKFFN